MPKDGPRLRFPILYPEEDTTLLACKPIWIGFRVVYGFLHREGMRRAEAAGLQFKDIDLDHETIAPATPPTSS